MTQEEQILAAIEEIGLKIEEIRKTSKNQPRPENVDFSPINQKLEKLEQKLMIIKENYNHSNSDLSSISSEVRQISRTIQSTHKEVVHKYIEVEKPIRWIVIVVSYFVISLSAVFLLVYFNSQLKDKLIAAKANDFKYRFLKVSDQKLPDSKIVKTTSDLVYCIDDYYKNNQKEVEKFVLKREEDLRIAFEASELAKQRELEAKNAREEALKLKKQADSLTNK
jgi:hypothetical protein